MKLVIRCSEDITGLLSQFSRTSSLVRIPEISNLNNFVKSEADNHQHDFSCLFSFQKQKVTQNPELSSLNVFSTTLHALDMKEPKLKILSLELFSRVLS